MIVISDFIQAISEEFKEIKFLKGTMDDKYLFSHSLLIKDNIQEKMWRKMNNREKLTIIESLILDVYSFYMRRNSLINMLEKVYMQP